MGTNGLLVEKRFHEFSPTPYLTFNVHLDGLDEHHDHAVCHKGAFKKATEAIRLFPLELMQMILSSVKSNEVFGRIIKKKKFQIELRGFAPIGMLEYWNYGIMGSGRLAKIQASMTSCKFNEL